jgi:hypothetical protein
MTPTAELRAALGAVGVEVLGVKESGAYIGLVTDAANGKTDGTITPNEDIIIEGNKMKVAPADETGLGVFFVAADGAETPVTHRLTVNTPKKLIARVPALAAGMYTLKVVTRFSQGNVFLKEPRSIIYNQMLPSSNICVAARINGWTARPALLHLFSNQRYKHGAVAAVHWGNCSSEFPLQMRCSDIEAQRLPP